jgi:transcriptional regulator with XRE-family HTH domain
MTLGQKLTRLRSLEGLARGLDRDMTQSEVSKAIREELDGQISQSYLSQLESGTRPHLTSSTRLLLARFFKVHPGYLVDDLADSPSMAMRPRRELDDRLDLWLIEGSQEFDDDARLSEALLQIAKHPRSRDCLIVFGSIVENRELIERLIDKTDASAVQTRGRKRRT